MDGWAGFVTAAHAGDELMRFCAAKADPRTALEAEAYAAGHFRLPLIAAGPPRSRFRAEACAHGTRWPAGLVWARVGITPSEHSGVCPMAVIAASAWRLLRG